MNKHWCALENGGWDVGMTGGERERENQRVKFSKSVIFQELSTTVSEVKEIHS